MAGILEYSTTPASNTTINGIGIQGTNKVLNFDNALRQFMADEASSITRIVDKSAGTYTALKTDFNQIWRATGACTFNLTAAATLTSGWCMWFKADGGAITIDPNASETINGASTLNIPNGATALITCTGIAFQAITFATAAQGTLADSATQPGDLATVATSGDYADLTNKPDLPAVTADTMLLDNSAGTAREAKGRQDILDFLAADSSDVAWKSSETGAVSRTVAQVISQAPINVQDFGAVGDNSTTNDAAFLAAANALGDGGGTIFVPRGRYRFGASGALNLVTKFNVRIFGEAGNYSPRHYDDFSTLIGKAGYPLIVFDGGQGFECDHLELTYDEATFGQRLIKLPKTSGLFDTSEVHIHHCRIGGNGASGSDLIDCYNCYNVVIEKNSFDQGQRAIYGASPGQYANSITIRENFFGNAIETGILAGGHTWRVVGNVHEPRSSDGAVLAFGVTTAGLQGLVYEGNHLDDGGSTGTWVNLSRVEGGSVRGNWIKQGLHAFYLGTTTSNIEINGNFMYASESQAPIDNGGATDIIALANRVTTVSGSNVPNLLTSTTFSGAGMYDNKDGSGIITY